MNRRHLIPILIAAGLLASGSATALAPATAAATGGSTAPAAAAAPRHTRAVAVVHAASGSQVHGIVRFAPTDEGLRITADIKGLKPNSSHGFHIHEYGDCSAPDARSAGGHYNPEHSRHAGPNAAHHHAGDLGNIRANGAGEAHLAMTVTDISINGTRNPVLGRAVIVHKDADDFKSQPSGNAGARIGCGVIGLAKP